MLGCLHPRDNAAPLRGADPRADNFWCQSVVLDRPRGVGPKEKGASPHIEGKVLFQPVARRPNHDARVHAGYDTKPQLSGNALDGYVKESISGVAPPR